MAQRTQTWTCQQCGKACERIAVRGRFPKFCDPTCYRRHDELARAMRGTCAWCGDEFAGSRRKQSHCSLTCSNWSRHHGRPSTSRELVLWQAEPRPTYRAECGHCGVEYIGDALRPRRHCSDACRKRASWARRYLRKGDFYVSPGRRLRLYERDVWTCQICGEQTSRIYASDDLLSPTLDHIEPQARTLVPDHSDAALRTAHLICNSYRNDARMTDAEVRTVVLARIA